MTNKKVSFYMGSRGYGKSYYELERKNKIINKIIDEIEFQKKMSKKFGNAYGIELCNILLDKIKWWLK